MGRPSAGLFLGFLFLVFAAEAGLLLGKGVLLIDQHEGDALHLIEIALRMSEGQRPHFDFMTPIGFLAFAPSAWLVALGAGAGTALTGGMLLFAGFVLPMIWWVGYSRLSTVFAYTFGAVLMILVTALVYGGETTHASISMFYNRWAWAVTFLLVTLAILPAGRVSSTADGAVYGVGLAFLALSKITFFAAFLPGILLALVLRRQWTILMIAVSVGLFIGAIVSLVGGFGFWGAYFSDLRAVQQSGIRPQPGQNLAFLLTAPVFLVGNLCLIAGVVLLRQGGKSVEGLLLAAFAPAFIYVTFQNWGNDPKWLILLAILLISLRPERHTINGLGWDIGRSLGLVSLLSAVLILPSMASLTFANLRHARLDQTEFFQLLPGSVHSDLKMRTDRMYATVKRAPFSLSDPHINRLAVEAVQLPKDELFGQPLALCKLHMGLVGVLHQMAIDLEKIEATRGKSILVADTFSNLWLFGSTIAVPGGAPWNYGADADFQSADFLLVPLCPITPAARSAVLASLAKETPRVNLSEIARNELFILLQVLPD